MFKITIIIVKVFCYLLANFCKFIIVFDLILMNDVPPTKVMLYNLKQLFCFLYLLLVWSVCADYKVILRKRVVVCGI